MLKSHYIPCAKRVGLIIAHHLNDTRPETEQPTTQGVQLREWVRRMCPFYYTHLLRLPPRI
jgi:hypothetical protein